MKAEGYLKDHETLMSVFSAPNYLDTGGNKGAFLQLAPGPDGSLQAGTFQRASRQLGIQAVCSHSAYVLFFVYNVAFRAIFRKRGSLGGNHHH